MTESFYHPTPTLDGRPIGTTESGLLVIEAPLAMTGERLRLRAPEETLGRHGTVVLHSAMVSRRHARIWVANGATWIEDLGSANGTFVNGEPVTGPHALLDGDRVGIGDVEAAFHLATLMDQERRPRPAHLVPDPAVPDRASSDSTRYLCAATHIDHRFREKVLDTTVRERHRAVCPSHGFDLSVVTRHALLAHRRALLRDVGLAAVLGVAIGVATVIVAGWPSIDAARAGAMLALGVMFLILAWVVLATETWVRLSTLGRYLRPGERPDFAPHPKSTRDAQLLAALADANAGNLVVYSDYQPFVGSGVPVDRSSYPVPLLPRGDDLPSGAGAETDPARTVVFSTAELLDEISKGLDSLRLQDLQIDRRLFVDGLDVARFRELLPTPRGRPLASAPRSLLDEVVEHPFGAVRPYLCAQFTGWRGELVVTTFIRVVVLTGLLFVETATNVLAPLRDEYLAVDRMRIRTTRERVGATIGQTTTGLLPALFAAPFRLAAAGGARRHAAQNERDFKRRLADRVRIDRGATSSIREGASRDDFDRYFMQLDSEMARLVLRQKVADTIAAFLADRGYQVDKINNIQNNISYDSSIRIDNRDGNIVGVGTNARGNNSGGSQQNMARGGSQ